MIRTFVHSILALAAGLASLSLISAPAHCVAQLWGIQPATNRIVQVDPATGATFGGFTPPGGALIASQQFGGLTMAEHGADCSNALATSHGRDSFLATSCKSRRVMSMPTA